MSVQPRLSAVAYKFWCGVEAVIHPLAVYTSRLITDKVNDEIPPVDTAPFMVEVPDAAVPTSYVDEDNPEYQRLMNDRARRVNVRVNELFFEAAVELPQADVYLKDPNYQRRIDTLRGVLDLDKSDYWVLLHHICLANPKDEHNVIRIAQSQLPLREGEISDGLRLFRLDVVGDGLRDTESVTSSVP